MIGMPAMQDSMIHAIPFYAIMPALDKMGIGPDLLGRQTSIALAPIMQDLSKTLLDGQLPKDVNEFFEMLIVIEITGMADPNTFQTEIKDHACHISLTASGRTSQVSLKKRATNGVHCASSAQSIVAF